MHNVSTGWVTLITTVVFLLFSVLVLPPQAARTEGDVGSAESPDTSFYYSVDDLYRMARVYGEQGRAAYVRARFTFDVIWPLIYTAFLGTAISWIYARVCAVGSRWRRANLIPVLGALFDYLENLSASIVMARYPQQTVVVDRLTPVFTMVKWVFVSGSFAVLLLGVIVGIWSWVKRRG
ncbi:MAG TPA: hypothetical protein ENN99_10725 [Chloroflexi bacterium]|nr:hypothetical protein [Chloroflexota bacterium]